jgi:hypothetical protein
MYIENLDNIIQKEIFLHKDKNDREINIFKLNNAMFTGEDLFYPNTLLFLKDVNKLYNPVQENIMSLKQVANKESFTFIKEEINRIEETPVFYFIYNTENYYHFIYDSLPYLITYKHLKKKIPNLKLLMNFPNSFKDTNYKFVDEFLDILEVTQEDILLVDKNTEYTVVYISSSYTHGHDSNVPPRKEIYELYEYINKKINSLYFESYKDRIHKKIYISRRTWINNDHSNIGTNYTFRRKMINEDILVNELKNRGFKEVFTENLSTIEKIILFSNADFIVGAIGGGMCNLLFADPSAISFTICSPTFLDVNGRFIYSLNGCRNKLLDNNKHASQEKYKKFMRVISENGIVGEIEEIKNNIITIIYSDKKVAGWSSGVEYKKESFNPEHLKPLDNGLNSEWICDIQEVLGLLERF